MFQRFSLPMILIAVGLLLVGCGSKTKNDKGKDTSTNTTQPTIELNSIPLPQSPTPIPIPITADDPRFPIQPASGEALTNGQQLYETHCASCHGTNGEGQQPDPYASNMAPPHNDAGHTWHHPDQQNFQTVWVGRNIAGEMPGFSDKLSADEILQILAYIKTWWSDESLAVQIDRTQSIINQ